MAQVDTLAELIARMEGWYAAGTLAQRNNNPGNLRAGPRAIGKANGFAVYASAEDGWADLYRQIGLDADAGNTVETFINKYAPPNENNTSGYLGYLLKGLGVSAETPLSDLYEVWSDQGAGEEGQALAEPGSGSTWVWGVGIALGGAALLLAMD